MSDETIFPTTGLSYVAHLAVAPDRAPFGVADLEPSPEEHALDDEEGDDYVEPPPSASFASPSVVPKCSSPHATAAPTSIR